MHFFIIILAASGLVTGSSRRFGVEEHAAKIVQSTSLEADKFALGEPGTARCANGQIKEPSLCADAADELVSRMGWQVVGYGGTYNINSFPQGCHLNGMTVFFNTHPSGGASGKLTPVCCIDCADDEHTADNVPSNKPKECPPYPELHSKLGCIDGPTEEKIEECCCTGDCADDQEEAIDIDTKPGDEDEVKEAVKDGRLLTDGLSNGWCRLLTVGANKCVASGSDACACHFRGHKAIACPDIFKRPNKVYAVLKNTKVALFKGEGCECSNNNAFPIASECTLKIGEINPTHLTPPSRK